MYEYFWRGYHQLPFPPGSPKEYQEAYNWGEQVRVEIDNNGINDPYVEGIMDELSAFMDKEDIGRTKDLIKSQLGINGLAYQIHLNAHDKGFWDNTSLVEKLALIHSEVSEVLEADRKEMGEEVLQEELADILIRTLDVCSSRGMDIEEVMNKKVSKNKKRPKMHGRKY